MVKPEQQLRKLNPPSNPIAYSIPDHSPLHSEVVSEVEPESVPDIKEDRALSPEEIANAFLECYSDFIGTDLENKTVWKSETFNRTLKTD